MLVSAASVNVTPLLIVKLGVIRTLQQRNRERDAAADDDAGHRWRLVTFGKLSVVPLAEGKLENRRYPSAT